MSSVNKVVLIGNLGANPEPMEGKELCKMRLATSYTHNGEEQTEWHRITVFGKQADACAKYLAKGSKVYVEGRLKTSQYEKNGEKRYSTEIVATNVVFLSKADKGAEIPF